MTPIPKLAECLTDRLLTWVEVSFASSTPKCEKWYQTECAALTAYKPLARTTLDEITGELASSFAAHRLRQGKAIATVNSALLVLRQHLNLAEDLGFLRSAPKEKPLAGEKGLGAA